MTAPATTLCEWDAQPNPHFNLWTIGNSSEVVPGISTPFISTMGRHFEAGGRPHMIQPTVGHEFHHRGSISGTSSINCHPS